ncbi:hypothetical protein BCR35DRAFT_304939 [Leucosporidium creatinivorum]|uniref:Uncharacterized protein n=1 Tax=Leucosporidium creatinivorum TaxID=106004 RepID=A0A1Y2F4W5_9BASI|nr:hypothetical protein BCR35DRAFT_304939 [Leucosporidium creatinivorum]
MRSAIFAAALTVCYLPFILAQSPSTTFTMSTATSISWDFSSTPSGYQIGGTQGASILSAWDAAHPEESYWATQSGTSLRDISTETPGRVWMGSTVGVAETLSRSVESSATATSERTGAGATAAATGEQASTRNTMTTEDTASSGASSFSRMKNSAMALVLGVGAISVAVLRV